MQNAKKLQNALEQLIKDNKDDGRNKIEIKTINLGREETPL